MILLWLGSFLRNRNNVEEKTDFRHENHCSMPFRWMIGFILLSKNKNKIKHFERPDDKSFQQVKIFH